MLAATCGECMATCPAHYSPTLPVQGGQSQPLSKLDGQLADKGAAACLRATQELRCRRPHPGHQRQQHILVADLEDDGQRVRNPCSPAATQLSPFAGMAFMIDLDEGKVDSSGEVQPAVVLTREANASMWV